MTLTYAYVSDRINNMHESTLGEQVTALCPARDGHILCLPGQ